VKWIDCRHAPAKLICFALLWKAVSFLQGQTDKLNEDYQKGHAMTPEY
jgi:hypothetical protein